MPTEVTPTARAVTTRDGRRLRLLEAGAGKDLVILEAGLGASAASWSTVMASLAAHAHVVAYDRAGYGGSDPAASPRTFEHLADDLLAIVDATPHDRLVLVGHSLGGPVVRVAAARHLARGSAVTGLLLVDPSDERCELYFGSSFEMTSTLHETLTPGLARLGALEPITRAVLAALGPDQAAAAAHDATTPNAVAALRAESAAFQDELRRLRDAPPELGETPVTILSGAVRPGPDARSRRALVRAHRDSAAALPRGRHTIAPDSGHLVPFTEPLRVSAEALALLGAGTGPRTRTRTALVTGAANGIGRATALRLMRAGFRVGAFDVDVPALERLHAEAPHPERLVTRRLDVTNEAEWRAALTDLVGTAGDGSGDGKLDVLVNNAGILAAGAFEAISFGRQRATIDINVTGTMLGCFTCHDALARARGTVVNLCSAAAISGQPDLASYGASKAAVQSLTEALDLEWAPQGITVRALWPLYAKTAMVDGVDIGSTRSLGIRLEPDDVARAVADVIRRPPRLSAHRSAGVQASVLRALAQVTPDAMTRLVNRRIAER